MTISKLPVDFDWCYQLPGALFWKKISEIECRFNTKVMWWIINFCHRNQKGKWNAVYISSVYISSILTQTQLRCDWLLTIGRVSGSPGTFWSRLWLVIESHLILSIMCFVFFKKYLLPLSIIISISGVSHIVICLAFSTTILFLAGLPVHQRLDS